MQLSSFFDSKLLNFKVIIADTLVSAVFIFDMKVKFTVSHIELNMISLSCDHLNYLMDCPVLAFDTHAYRFESAFASSFWENRNICVEGLKTSQEFYLLNVFARSQNFFDKVDLELSFLNFTIIQNDILYCRKVDTITRHWSSWCKLPDFKGFWETKFFAVFRVMHRKFP